MLEFPYNKEKKLERMTHLINVIENLFNKFTTNKNVIGHTIRTIHTLWILILIILLLVSPTITNIILLICYNIIMHGINAYFGGGSPKGCVLTRLERYFFEDKDYYGGINTFYNLINKSPPKNTQKHLENLLMFLWLLIIGCIIYKISKCLSKNTN
jgi:hypothetical protein